VGIVSCALIGASLAAAAEQSQTSSVINFEVISVDGNYLVIRDQNGTRALTVPAGFQFTVNGKPMSVNELAAGMKGTATVTTTTTTHPVYVTEIRKGTVLRKSGQSIIRGQMALAALLRTRRMPTDGNFMDGKPVKVWRLGVRAMNSPPHRVERSTCRTDRERSCRDVGPPAEPEPEPMAGGA
jgi:hypothetical protein